jgi:hypothetical protein
MAVCAAPPVDCTLAGRARRCLDRNQFEHDEIIAADIANDNAGSCRRVLALPATMLPARRASIAESSSRQSRQAGSAHAATVNPLASLTGQIADLLRWRSEHNTQKLPQGRLLQRTKRAAHGRNGAPSDGPDCFSAVPEGQKKAQPRGVALRIHQRRRFWRICAGTCKDAQRVAIMSSNALHCKQFLLLCNNFRIKNITLCF